MAGIGFELKKLFSKKGISATIRAYSYATMVCAGPMIMGFILLLGVMFIATHTGAIRHDRELMVSMITYALLSSLVVTSIFSMLTTRFLADMVYEKKYTKIIPSFYGSLGIMLVVGGLAYGIFLFFSGVIFSYKLLSFLLFMTLIVVWTEINFLTAIKDYKGIIITFFVSIIAVFIIAIILIWIFKVSTIFALMISMNVGYGIMMIWYFILLYKYFPEGFGTTMEFLRWFDTHPQLSLIGFFTTLALFGHLVIMWFSDVHVQVEGLFYGAPTYDVPAIFAFFSILVTTVNFTTSVEVRFYPTYRNYFALFNDGGSISNIDEAEKNMIRVLTEELGYLAQKQLLSTMAFLIIGTIVLPQLPLGFNNEMLKIFRVLCVGYGFYAIGNSIMLISQYYADLKGALIDATVYVIVATAATILIMLFAKNFYGFGFVLGGMAYCATAWVRLCMYLRKLKYNVLSTQSIFIDVKSGFFTRIANTLQGRCERVQRRRQETYFKNREKDGENETKM